MVNQIQFNQVASVPRPRLSGPVKAPATTPFSQVLESQVRSARKVRFSAHALERLAGRGLTLTAADRGRIERALDQVAAKGARETLLLMDRLALVVSVPNRTVITVVPHDEMEDNVFTNIDSAVLVSTEAPLPPLE